MSSSCSFWMSGLRSGSSKFSYLIDFPWVLLAAPSLFACAIQLGRPASHTEMIQVTTGEGHTCALIATGEVRCWGKNHEGQLGDGTNLDTRELAP